MTLFADRLEVMNSGRLPPPLTVDKLRLPHQSLPGNPLLAESMYLLRYIERMGTGTVDMIRRCAEAVLREPEFDVSTGFLTRVWRPGGASDEDPKAVGRQPGEDRDLSTTHNTTPSTPDTTQINRPDTQKTTRERILDYLRAEPELTRRELAERIGVTPDGIKYHLRKLKADGSVRRVGSDRAGRWVVTDRPADGQESAGNRPEDRPEPSTTRTTTPTTQINAAATQITTQEKILSYLRAEPELTRRELAERIGITPDGIKYHLGKLKAAGAIRRVGSDRAGRWEVVK